MAVFNPGTKMLVPLDNSEHSQRALENAICLAKKFDGKIVLVHVLPSPATIYRAHSPNLQDYPIVHDSLQKLGSVLLADAEKRVRDEGIQVEIVLKTGHTSGQILKTCEEFECDCIIMGSRGIGRIQEIFMGSVSDGVARYGNCPVMVVK